MIGFLLYLTTFRPDILKYKLEDYHICGNIILIFCKNIDAICLTKHPIQHSRTKHVEVKHYFIRNNVQKGVIDI